MSKSKTVIEEYNKWRRKKTHNELRIRKWEDFLTPLSSGQKYKDKTLGELIYYGKINRDELEERPPSDKDINQGGRIFSTRNNYTQFGSCACLAVLMGMARQNSESIRKLIEPDLRDPGVVWVNLRDVKFSYHVKKRKNDKNEPYSCDLVFDFEPRGILRKKVTAKELLNSCKATRHRRLWPLVVEIALAKAMKNNFISFTDSWNVEFKDYESSIREDYAKRIADFFIKTFGSSSDISEKDIREACLTGGLTTQEIESKVKEYPEEKRAAAREMFQKLNEICEKAEKNFEDGKEEFEDDIIYQIKKQFDNEEGYCFLFTTALTGKKSRSRFPLNLEACEKYERKVKDTQRRINTSCSKKGYFKALSGKHISKEIGKFSSRDGQKDKYAPQEIRLFEKIQKKLNKGEVVTASFSSNLIRNSTAYQQTLENTVNIMSNSFSLEPITKDGKHLFKHKDDEVIRTKEEVEGYIEDMLQRERDNLGRSSIKTVKKKEGILSSHAYSVVGAFAVEAGDEVTAEEKPTYRFIVIENPHDMHTSINYRDYSKRCSETARQFLEENEKFEEKEKFYINNNRTCIMELNHFSKLLKDLTYSRD